MAAIRRRRVGTLELSAGPTVPAGWMRCDGAAISRTTYAALFAEIGVSYGAGDGSTTFNIPDYRGRVPVGWDTAVGGVFADRIPTATANTRTLGSVGGAATVTLTTAQLASHTHDSSLTIPEHNHPWLQSGGGGATIDTTSGGGSRSFNAAGASAAMVGDPLTGSYWTAPSSDILGTNPVSGSINNAGSGDAHNNVQPVLTTNIMIKVL